MEHPIKLYRDKHNISLEELAKLANTTRASLSRIENGLQTPSPNLMNEIKRATNGEVPVDALFKFHFPEASTPPEKIIKTDSSSELAGEEEESISGEVCAEMEQSPQF